MASLSFGYAEPLTPARFDLHDKLAFLAQDRLERTVSAPGRALAAVAGGRRVQGLDADGNLEVEKWHASLHMTFVVGAFRPLVVLGLR